MVGIFVQLIKLSKLNISAQEMTDLLLTRFLSSGHCPLCGAGNLRNTEITVAGFLNIATGKLSKVNCIQSGSAAAVVIHHTPFWWR